MKKLIGLAVLISLCAFACAQDADLAKAVKPGTKLLYMVYGDDEPYDLTITLIDKKGSSFKWTIEAESKFSGTIAHTSKGLLNAQALHHIFLKGTKKLDDKNTSLWLSQKLFNHFTRKKGQPIKVWMNGLKEPALEMGTYLATQRHTVMINGVEKKVEEELVVGLVKSGEGYGPKDNSDSFTFYPDKNFPIILRMTGTVSLELLSVKTK